MTQNQKTNIQSAGHDYTSEDAPHSDRLPRYIEHTPDSLLWYITYTLRQTPMVHCTETRQTPTVLYPNSQSDSMVHCRDTRQTPMVHYTNTQIAMVHYTNTQTDSHGTLHKH